MNKLTDKELATVLAALRLWQRNLDSEYKNYGIVGSKKFFLKEKPLSPDEIDSLCEKLNHENHHTHS